MLKCKVHQQGQNLYKYQTQPPSLKVLLFSVWGVSITLTFIYRTQFPQPINRVEGALLSALHVKIYLRLTIIHRGEYVIFSLVNSGDCEFRGIK